MIIISEDFDSTQEDEVKEKGVKSKNRENHPSEMIIISEDFPPTQTTR